MGNLIWAFNFVMSSRRALGIMIFFARVQALLFSKIILLRFYKQLSESLSFVPGNIEYEVCQQCSRVKSIVAVRVNLSCLKVRYINCICSLLNFDPLFELFTYFPRLKCNPKFAHNVLNMIFNIFIRKHW